MILPHQLDVENVERYRQITKAFIAYRRKGRFVYFTCSESPHSDLLKVLNAGKTIGGIDVDSFGVIPTEQPTKLLLRKLIFHVYFYDQLPILNQVVGPGAGPSLAMAL